MTICKRTSLMFYARRCAGQKMLRGKRNLILLKRGRKSRRMILFETLLVSVSINTVIYFIPSSAAPIHPPGIHPSRKLPRFGESVPKRPHPKPADCYRWINDNREGMGLWRFTLASVLQTVCGDFSRAQC